ncbi:MAG: helix-turn-helix transcriptional regulator [Eubacteriales bacterium]
MAEPLSPEEGVFSVRDAYQTNLSCFIGDTAFSVTLDTGFFNAACMTYEPHMHFEWELQLSLSDHYAVEFCTSGDVICPGMGRLLLIPPGCYHNTLIADADAQTERKYALRFTFRRTETQEKESFFKRLNDALPGDDTPFVLEIPEAVGILHTVYEELLGHRPGGGAMAHAELCRFFILFARALFSCRNAERDAPSETADADDAPMYPVGTGERTRKDTILRILDKQYSSPLREQMLADMLGISVRSVSRLFADAFGTSFRQTLTDVRLRHAEKFLVRTDIPAEQIALRVGYTSSSAFFTAFRKKYGMTPHAYRKKQRMRSNGLLRTRDNKEIPSETGQNPLENGVLKD